MLTEKQIRIFDEMKMEEAPIDAVQHAHSMVCDGGRRKREGDKVNNETILYAIKLLTTCFIFFVAGYGFGVLREKEK